MTSETTYRVVGAHAVLGVKPGGRLKAAGVPDEQLERLVARGSLEVVPQTNKAVRDTDSGKEQD